MKTLSVGYVPLTDSLPLFVLKELGFDRAEDIHVELKKMGSWAQVRDALLSGQVQAAHCLAGIPLASQAGLYGDHSKLATAFTLNHFGNAITLSRQLFGEDPRHDMAGSLKRVMQNRDRQSRPLTLASVFPVSKHEFELRFWLRSLGLDPERDLRLVVIPPPLIADSLQAGRIDGFCVGEPWNSLAVRERLGVVATTSRELNLPGTEKVLAVNETWLSCDEHFALLRGLAKACRWLAQPINADQATDILADGLELPRELLAPALLENRPLNGPAQEHAFVVFDGINRPNLEDADWLLQQIHQQPPKTPPFSSSEICERAFRPHIYDHALSS